MSDPEGAARDLLSELEERLATKDIDQMTDLFADDVVLIGDDGENFDRSATVEYLSLMAGMSPTVRWKWSRVAVVLSQPGLLGFAAAGSIWFDDESRQRIDDPKPFRL